MNLTKNDKYRKSYDRKYFILLVVSFLVFILQRRFFARDTLNYPYIIYYVVVFFCLFLVLLGKRKRLKDIVEGDNTIPVKGITFAGVVFKYMMLYFIVLISITLLLFGIINNWYSKRNEIESYSEKVVHLSGGTSRSFASIQFYFKGKINSFSGAKEVYKLFDKNNSSKEAYFVFECRKGLLGSYILEDWDIQLNEK